MSRKTVVLFGDSHAEHWFPALEPATTEQGWHLITMIKSSCPAARVEVYSLALRRIEHECSIWREAALGRIVRLRPAVVLIGEFVGYVQTLGRDGADQRLTTAQWGDGLLSTLQYLDSAGVKTIIVADVPRAGFDVPTCLSRAAVHSRQALTCTLQRSVSLDHSVRQAEANAASRVGNVPIFDFADQFCSDFECPPVIDGQVVYRDSNHLTATFARTLAPELALRLTPLVGH